MTSERMERLRSELRHMRDDLQQAADQIRLKLHLAGMDAKDAWAKVEPRLHDFEHKAEGVTDDVESDLRQAGRDLKSELERIKEALQ